MIVLAAAIDAESPDAHKRLTVSPGTLTGRPASNKAIRATFLFILTGLVGAAEDYIANNIYIDVLIPADQLPDDHCSEVVGTYGGKCPPKLPMGVRMPSMMNASFMVGIFVNHHTDQYI